MSAVERPTDGPDSGDPDLCAALQASLDQARGRVCPVEDCPRPKDPKAADCGEHEEWMT